MSILNYYTTPNDNLIDDHVYEMVNNIEMNTFNVGQDKNSSSPTNADYARATILDRQSDDYDYAHRENINESMYVYKLRISPKKNWILDLNFFGYLGTHLYPIQKLNFFMVRTPSRCCSFL